MLLDDFLKPSIVQLSEFGQVVHISDDVTQILLQQHEIFFYRYVLLLCLHISILRKLWSPFIQSSNHIIDLLLTGFYPSHNLP